MNLQDITPLRRRTNLEHPDSYPWLSIEDRATEIPAQAGDWAGQADSLAWLVGSLWPSRQLGPQSFRSTIKN